MILHNRFQVAFEFVTSLYSALLEELLSKLLSACLKRACRESLLCYGRQTLPSLDIWNILELTVSIKIACAPGRKHYRMVHGLCTFTTSHAPPIRTNLLWHICTISKPHLDLRPSEKFLQGSPPPAAWPDATVQSRHILYLTSIVRRELLLTSDGGYVSVFCRPVTVGAFERCVTLRSRALLPTRMIHCDRSARSSVK